MPFAILRKKTGGVCPRLFQRLPDLPATLRPAVPVHTEAFAGPSAGTSLPCFFRISTAAVNPIDDITHAMGFDKFAPTAPVRAISHSPAKMFTDVSHRPPTIDAVPWPVP